jgi:N-acetylated-alpha-linked acidic dipeptidase
LDDANATLFEATLKEDDDTQATPTFHGKPKKEKDFFSNADRDKGKSSQNFNSLFLSSLSLFHLGYSGDGDVTAPVVYVNYGTLTDFEYLQVLGINVKGSIALVRSGAISRGLKVRAAERFGCIGVLIYNDPGDQPSDGKVYPDGPWQVQ